MTSILKVDTIQTAAGGTPTAADLGLNVSGSVLQVVNYKTNTQYTSTSSTFADMPNFSASITPKSASSTILLLARVSVRHSGYNYGIVRWKRNGTTLDYPNLNHETGIGTTSADIRLLNPYIIYDNPATTSAVTYSADFAVHSNAGTFTVNSNAIWSYITLMEIAG